MTIFASLSAMSGSMKTMTSSSISKSSGSSSQGLNSIACGGCGGSGLSLGNSLGNALIGTTTVVGGAVFGVGVVASNLVTDLLGGVCHSGCY
ncbi:hypothetical protein CYY_002443 [Polysphondylium violaceum]|uniref:HssA/2C/7E family protein n=1 Tax=Polysphondylium violaceum TaxID=133409 RepID=A0A8J4PZD9_9MYCE|nr:hypothetical protein CYY_002443 [Polysphondylium violaceum]